jgi:predicted dehydrogenase
MSDPHSSSNQSRRDILKASAVIAGAAAGSFITRSAYAAGSGETIKVGLIGCGGRGTGAAGQALSTDGPVELVAVADAFEDQAHNAVKNLQQKFADRPERVKVTPESMFIGFDAYKKLIDSGIDLVIIATPPGFRPIHFEYAVEKGKNIFAEKPIATDAGGVRRFLEAAKKAKEKDLKVGIGLQRHHQAPYIDIVKRIQDGALGDLVLMRAYWNGTRPWVRKRDSLIERKRKETNNPNATLTEMEYQMRNWYYFTWLCGDHIVEQHIHNLDVINWIKGTHPVMAQGVGGKQVDTGVDSGQIFDHHMVEFTYADGTKLMSECRHMQNTWQSVSEHAHGTKGWAPKGSSAARLT